MRAPRALIPLLAVSGAAVVVVTAGAGAAIEQGDDPVPPVTDVAEGTRTTAVNVLNWNVCGDTDPRCPAGAKPAEVVRTVSTQLKNNVVGGRKVKANAVFLQEVCLGHVKAIAGQPGMSAWSWQFAPVLQSNGKPATCANGQGQFGVAMGAQQQITGVEKVYLPSPRTRRYVALCGNVASWNTRLCTAQLSNEANGEWRLKQTQKLTELAGARRVVFGGDFNDQPQKPALDVLYRSFSECDQAAGGTRAGERTYQNAQGLALAKTDYVFASKSAEVACEVPNQPVRISDHRPIAAVVNFR
ncbi:endonuclease/exonuclease/phosphatase family protein [Actinomadura rudentiformis]|uniref:endonuclease/exonuclease/phosphatase family protein n=1 Tax=Actinomadura rudentiformis TaxID=359158 RepID=UPI00178C55B2|nr:endonuclease/exonuclease/phosphatase family protein [Actinomadura rudentiformis]